MDNGLTVADIARRLHELNPELSEKSVYSMIDDMIHGRKFYPRHAESIKSEFGLILVRPAHLRPARQLLRQAA